MKTLFICHVEPLFEKSIPMEFLNDLEYLIRSGDYYTIVLDSGIDKPYDWLLRLADEMWHWSYGYEMDSFCRENCVEIREEDKWLVGMDHAADCEGKYIIQASGHDYTWVPYQLRERDFSKEEVWICGGYDGCCLEDWENVLDYSKIDYKRLEYLIYTEDTSDYNYVGCRNYSVTR